MKRNSRWVVAFLAAVTCAAALGLTVAACGGGEGSAPTEPAAAEPTETWQVGWFATKGNRFLAAELKAVQEQAKKHNIEITVFDPGFDPTKQFSQIQDAITLNRFDGFLILPLDGAAVVPLVEQAVEAGIKVVGANAPLGPDPDEPDEQIAGVSGQIWTSTVNRGQWMAQQIAEACAGIDACKVAYIAGLAALPIERTVKKFMESGIRNQDNISLVAYLDGGGYTIEGGEKVAQDLLLAHPDVNVIAAQDQSALGVELALKAAGKAYGTGTDEVRILGIGTACNSMEALRAGRLFSLQTDAALEEGWFSVDVMAQALQGELENPVAFDPIVKADLPPFYTKANAEERECQY